MCEIKCAMNSTIMNSSQCLLRLFCDQSEQIEKMPSHSKLINITTYITVLEVLLLFLDCYSAYIIFESVFAEITLCNSSARCLYARFYLGTWQVG